MIQINMNKTESDKIIKELKNKMDGVKAIKTPMNQEYLAKAIFTIAANAFVKNTNLVAASQQKKFHHIYEWGAIGNNNKRLFVVVRSAVRGGNLKIGTRFLDSKSTVPVSPKLKQIKGQKSFVFKKKATVMELGRPIVIVPKNGKVLMFVNNTGDLVFTKRSFVANPGGTGVKGSFTAHTKKWFSNPQNIKKAIVLSGMNKELEKELGLVLNKTGTGQSEANSVIRTVTTRYSKGTVTV